MVAWGVGVRVLNFVIGVGLGIQQVANEWTTSKHDFKTRAKFNLRTVLGLGLQPLNVMVST